MAYSFFVACFNVLNIWKHKRSIRKERCLYNTSICLLSLVKHFLSWVAEDEDEDNDETHLGELHLPLPGLALSGLLPVLHLPVKCWNNHYSVFSLLQPATISVFCRQKCWEISVLWKESLLEKSIIVKTHLIRNRKLLPLKIKLDHKM